MKYYVRSGPYRKVMHSHSGRFAAMDFLDQDDDYDKSLMDNWIYLNETGFESAPSQAYLINELLVDMSWEY